MNSIVFFGTEDFSLTALRTLVEADFPVVAVVTKPDSPKGRGHAIIPPAVKTYAETHGITVWQPQKLADITDEIEKLDHPAGVLVSYGKIIPQATLDLFTPGIINLHPSLLPKYRGPSPVETAIAAGDKETGISIIKLIAAMDAGPIYRQIRIPLHGKETAEELYVELGRQGSELLVETLPPILDGSLQPSNQADDATYCKLLSKDDGTINWNTAAATIEARIRAYHIWPQSRTTLGDIDVIITAAEVIDSRDSIPGSLTVENGSLIVGTGQDSLRILTLKPLGKKEMPVGAFLSGYHNHLGS